MMCGHYGYYGDSSSCSNDKVKEYHIGDCFVYIVNLYT